MKTERWAHSAIVAKLTLDISQHPTCMVQAAMRNLLALGRRGPDFEQVYDALEHVLAARGCGREIIPVEWL